MKPIYIHSGMAGAPQTQYESTDGSINIILEACLINGFNSKTVTSASASGGVLTLNLANDPGFEAMQTVEVAVSSVALVNGKHRVVANSNNQVTIAIAGLPDGAVGSSGAGITIKQVGAGWSKPYGNATTAVFRPPAGSRNYIRIFNPSNISCTASGYEEMSDVDTGVSEFPSTAQGEYLTMFGANGASNLPWFLVATDKWFIFSVGHATGAEVYAYGFMFFGDLAEPAKDGIYTSLLLSRTSGYFARAYDGIGNSTAQVDAVWLANYAYTDGMEPVSGFLFAPYVSVSDAANIYRGVLPNFYRMNPWNLSYKFHDIKNDVLGIDGRARPCYLLNFASPAPAAVAVDEEDWA